MQNVLNFKVKTHIDSNIHSWHRLKIINIINFYGKIPPEIESAAVIDPSKAEMNQSSTKKCNWISRLNYNLFLATLPNFLHVSSNIGPLSPLLARIHPRGHPPNPWLPLGPRSVATNLCHWKLDWKNMVEKLIAI